MNNLHAAEMLRAANVDRWNMVNVSRSQNLAEHIYNVLVIAVELASRVGADHLIPEVRSYAIIHDIEEVMTGDIPTPTKKHLSREIVELSESLAYQHEMKQDFSREVRDIVKSADRIEALLYLWNYAQGEHADGVFHKMENELAKDPIAHALYLDIRGWHHRVLDDFTGENDGR